MGTTNKNSSQLNTLDDAVLRTVSTWGINRVVPSILESKQVGEITLKVSRQQYKHVILFLQKSALTKFSVLSNITASYHSERKSQNTLIITLLSSTKQHRVHVLVSLPNGYNAPSITKLYKSASYWEREVWDMFGIYFSDHEDCRRLLSDYGFRGHPLNKEFPVTGYVDMVYNEITKRVTSIPVSLAQEMRIFQIDRNW